MKLKFTTREKLVVCFLVHGDTDQQISKATGMHINAVRSVTKAVMRKLCLRNRTEVAVWGWRNGLTGKDTHDQS